MQDIKIAFLGLGTMGYPMAGHLSNKGFEVCVYNRSAQKAQKWLLEYQGSQAKSIAQASQNADIVIACVGNDNDIQDVCAGDNGAFNYMKKGSIFIDHTTASASVARQLSSIAAEKGIAFMDAPVSGGQSGAENGTLTIMCGADKTVYEKAHDVLLCYAQKVTRMGDVGSGQLTKMVNQICIAGLLQGLSEAVAFAQNAGLDAKQVFDVIAKGAAQSWQMDNRHESMLNNEFDFGFAIKWMRKDLQICFNEAAENGSMLPITKMVDELYARIEANGGAQWDTSALVTLLPKRTDRDTSSKQ